MKTITLKNFKRVVSSLDGSASPEFPSWLLNFRASGAKLNFRYGVSEVVTSPVTAGQTYKCHTLEFVQNTSGVAEFLSVENRNGTVRPYSIHKTTLARTQIGTDTVSDTPWVVASYADNAYFINPDGTATVYRHVIGDSASFVKLADTAYTPPDEDASLTATPQAYGTRRNVTATDTFAISSGNLVSSGSTATFSTTNGVLTINSDSVDNGEQHRSLITITFGSSVDWSDRGYIAAEVLEGNIFKDPGGVASFEITNTTPQVKTGGTWRDCEFEEFVESDRVLITIRIKGVTGINAVEGVRFTIGGFVNDYGPGVACYVNPIKLGGQYLGADAGTDRIWDYADDGDDIHYAARYTQAAGGAPRSAVSQRSITKDGAQGSLLASYDTRLGGRTSLSVVAANTGTYTHVQFLRLMEDGTTWKELAVVANTSGTSPSTIDTYEENELSALTTISLGVDPVEPDPPFSTSDIVFAFPFKQFMFWLKNTGEANVQMSRVGDAEELYSDEATYDADDLTQPAQRTLADNADDIPVWGTQAGDVAFIVGSKAAYVLTGNFPVEMSPSRQIAGSRGIVGRYAGVRFRPKGGQYAAAYCDADFNIWAIASVPQFENDGRVQPVELSLPVRGKIREYLYTLQKYENPSLDVASTQLEFDEATSSLWVILGNRAAIFRQDLNGEGWEFSHYSLRTGIGDTVTSTCTDWSGENGTASSVTPGDAPWTQLGFPFESDDAYCVSDSLGTGTTKTTETLRITGITPPSLLPVSATITSFKYRAEFSKTGDLAVTNIDAQPTLSSVSSGTDRSTGITVTTTDQVEEYTPSVTPTVAQINDGECGLDLRFQQETWLSVWDDPANYSIVVTNSTSATMTVSVTYTAGGAKPPRAYVNITSLAQADLIHDVGCESIVLPKLGYGYADNGFTEGEGSLWVGNIPYPDQNLVVSGTTRVEITLTAGVGSTNVVRSVSGTVSTSCTLIQSTFSGSAALTAPTPAVVRVDVVEMRVCYDTTTSASIPNWVGWDRTCFTSDGRFVGVRSIGNTDVIEWDFRANDYITGTNRDAGYLPSDAEFVSQDFSFEGVTARFSGVQVHTSETTDTPTVFSKIVGGSFTQGFQTGYSSTRWWRFPILQRGINHVFKLTLPETDGGIEGLAFEFEPTSKSKVR